jgi:hypothetical protein
MTLRGELSDVLAYRKFSGLRSRCMTPFLWQCCEEVVMYRTLAREVDNLVLHALGWCLVEGLFSLNYLYGGSQKTNICMAQICKMDLPTEIICMYAQSFWRLYHTFLPCQCVSTPYIDRILYLAFIKMMLCSLTGNGLNFPIWSRFQFSFLNYMTLPSVWLGLRCYVGDKTIILLLDVKLTNRVLFLYICFI